MKMNARFVRRVYRFKNQVVDKNRNDTIPEAR
jgi:hypothetical protein